MRLALCTLALAATAAAQDRSSDLAAFQAMREYHGTLRGDGGSIESVRDTIKAHIMTMSRKVKASVLRQLDEGFEEKYNKTDHYHRCLAEALAAGGKGGIVTIYRRYKRSRGRDQLRLILIEALGGCGDKKAIDILVKLAFYDKEPKVAAAAVSAVAKLPQASEKKRKAVVKKLVRLYRTVTDRAAGKAKDTPQMEMYDAMKPAMNATLGKLTGQTLDSAAAWRAWLSENITQPWPE